MLEKIKLDLSDNFKQGDDKVLQELIDEATTDALSISNRENTEKNIKLLTSEITDYVKAKYLQRGAEGSKSLSDSGISTSFDDAYEKLRKDIVKSGKRVPFV